MRRGAVLPEPTACRPMPGDIAQAALLAVWVVTILLSLDRPAGAVPFTDVLVVGRASASNSSPPQLRDAAATRQQQRILDRCGSQGVRHQRSLPAAGGFIASVSPGGLVALQSDPEVLAVAVSPPMYGALAASVPRIRADIPQQRGIRGAGVTVAMVDSGIEDTHPNVAGRIVAESCFCISGCCPDGSAMQFGPGSAATRQAHGLRVTGILAGAGVIGAPGVAPAVDIVSVKVLDENNSGFLRDALVALDWIASERPDVQVINLSIATAARFRTFCDEQNAFTIGFANVLRTLRARGVLTFVASGNDSDVGGVAIPACVEAAVAVGATTGFDRIWSGSNRSPALDLLAPGVGIVSDDLDGRISSQTGTSMATPHAAGAAALMLSVDPNLSADAQERLLRQTGKAVFDRSSGLTFPRIDVARALRHVGPILGGGSASSDCLATWEFDGKRTNGSRPEVVCTDGDPTCDGDPRTGVCGFTGRVCFLRSDARLQACSTSHPVVAYRIARAAGESRSVPEATNLDALRGALPTLPIAEPTCSDLFHLTVDAPGGWIAFTALAEDGRRDYDRIQLRCRGSVD